MRLSHIQRLEDSKTSTPYIPVRRVFTDDYLEGSLIARRATSGRSQLPSPSSPRSRAPLTSVPNMCLSFSSKSGEQRALSILLPTWDWHPKWVGFPVGCAVKGENPAPNPRAFRRRRHHEATAVPHAPVSGFWVLMLHFTWARPAWSP